MSARRTGLTHGLQHYAEQIGVGLRTIKRWHSDGVKAKDYCPLDDPEKLAAWKARIFRRHCRYATAWWQECKREQAALLAVDRCWNHLPEIKKARAADRRFYYAYVEAGARDRRKRARELSRRYYQAHKADPVWVARGNERARLYCAKRRAFDEAVHFVSTINNLNKLTEIINNEYSAKLICEDCPTQEAVPLKSTIVVDAAKGKRAEFVRLYRDFSKRVVDIAAALRVAKQTCYRWLKENNAKTRRADSAKPRVQLIAEFERLYRTTPWGNAEIARRLRIAKHLVVSWRQDLGLQSKTRTSPVHYAGAWWRECEREQAALVAIDRCWSRHPEIPRDGSPQPSLFRQQQINNIKKLTEITKP